MPTVSVLRQAIVAVIESVPGAGHVHDRERFADNDKALKALYAHPDGTLKGWFVRRLSTREDSPAVGRHVVTHRWQIRCFMGFVDGVASEHAFDDLIEAVRDAFRADETMGGLAVSTIIDEAAGLQLDDAGPVLFAGLLCHAARMTLYTRHYE